MGLITYLYGDSKKTYNHEFIPYVFVFVFGYLMAIRIRSWRTLPLNIVLYIEHARFVCSLTDISAEIKSLVPKSTKQSAGEDFAASLKAIQGKT